MASEAAIMRAFLVLEESLLPTPKKWRPRASSDGRADRQRAAKTWALHLHDVDDRQLEAAVVAYIQEPTQGVKWWPQVHAIRRHALGALLAVSGDDAWGHLLSMLRQHGGRPPVPPGARHPWTWHDNAAECSAREGALVPTGGYAALFRGSEWRQTFRRHYRARVELAAQRWRARPRPIPPGARLWHEVADDEAAAEDVERLAAEHGPADPPTLRDDVQNVYRLAGDQRVEVAMWRALAAIGGWRALRLLPDGADVQAPTRATFRRTFELALQQGASGAPDLTALLGARQHAQLEDRGGFAPLLPDMLHGRK